MGRSVGMKSGATSGKSSLSAWPAAVGAAIVSLWFDCGARGVTSCPLHEQWPCIERSTHGALI